MEDMPCKQTSSREDYRPSTIEGAYLNRPPPSPPQMFETLCSPPVVCPDVHSPKGEGARNGGERGRHKTGRVRADEATPAAIRVAGQMKMPPTEVVQKCRSAMLYASNKKRGAAFAAQRWCGAWRETSTKAQPCRKVARVQEQMFRAGAEAHISLWREAAASARSPTCRR